MLHPPRKRPSFRPMPGSDVIAYWGCIPALQGVVVEGALTGDEFNPD